MTSRPTGPGQPDPRSPEHGLTPGVETTTGPLGQGLANAVGMAMAARRERGLFDPDTPRVRARSTTTSTCSCPTGTSKRHHPRGLGHRGGPGTGQPDRPVRRQPHLDRGRHHHRKDEDTAARYEAYGWHVQRLSWDTPDGYHEDVQALYDAFEAAKAETSRPSFISLRTIIGWPAPNKQGTGAAHGSALGDAEVAATKKILGFDPDVNFRWRRTWSTTPAR